jgi:hypothetical protein
MGREPQTIIKTFNKGKKSEVKIKVELFPWEKLDLVEAFKKGFGLNGKVAVKAAEPTKDVVTAKAAKPAKKEAAKPTAKAKESAKPAKKKAAAKA